MRVVVVGLVYFCFGFDRVGVAEFDNGRSRFEEDEMDGCDEELGENGVNLFVRNRDDVEFCRDHDFLLRV